MSQNMRVKYKEKHREAALWCGSDEGRHVGSSIFFLEQRFYGWPKEFSSLILSNYGNLGELKEKTSYSAGERQIVDCNLEAPTPNLG